MQSSIDAFSSELKNIRTGRVSPEILKTIVSLKGYKTVLIIAHRLKTIENCDKIIELKDGAINKITTPKEMFENVKQ